MSPANKEPRNHAVTAALLGGAVAATAGAVWSARAIARRNGAPLNSVLKTAATACELAHSPGACDEAASDGESGGRDRS
jgi:hypothetical protein